MAIMTDQHGTGYFKGDKVKLTGTQLKEYTVPMFEYEFLEGRFKGEKIVNVRVDYIKGDK